MVRSLTPVAGSVTLQCPLCGYHFAPEALACSSHCPLHAGCRIVCCPHCAYGFLPPPPVGAGGLVHRWQNIWRSVWRRLGARD
jgi:hypothetical protein